MKNTPEYYKTYYTIQQLIMSLSDDHQPPKSVNTPSKLYELTRKMADKVHGYYEK